MLKPEQKYKLDEHVIVQGWGGKNSGTVKDIAWIFHHRLSEHTWGYMVELDEGQTPRLTFTYIPEGYLRKDEDEKES